jgi:hypothetical protein
MSDARHEYIRKCDRMTGIICKMHAMNRLLMRSPSLNNKLGDRIKLSNPLLTIRVFY